MERDVILVIGSANMDMVVFTGRFPQPGETVLGKQFAMFPGGKGANQSVCCARLGGKTLFLGKMGKDIFREKLSANMQNDGVNLDHLLVDAQEPTGVALITVDGSGQNEIVVASGSNMKLTAADIQAKKPLFSQAKIVLTQLEIPLETVIASAKLAKENNCIFILNPAPGAALPAELFHLIDFLTPNETELEILSGMAVSDKVSAATAAKCMLKKGVKNIIVTLGEKGALLVNSTREKLIPTRRVPVVDTTAAGDAFNGAFAYSLANGTNVEEAIRFANTVASFSVTRKGAQSSMPSMNEIRALKGFSKL